MHFYQSDQSLFDAVDGLDLPDKEKHATLISVEPVCCSFFFLCYCNKVTTCEVLDLKIVAA